MVRSFVLGMLACASLAPQAMAEGNASHGKVLFQQRCAICHATSGTAGGIGPNLSGVYGRRSAATKFSYSPAMQKAGLTWDAPTLSSYLTSPGKKVPGARMTVSVPNASDRDDIIAFLKMGS
jgi:cytochrome c